MAENTLGRYVTIWKGTYNPLTAYERLDTVYHESAIYLCTRDCTGVPPDNAEYWVVTLRSATREDMESAQAAVLAAQGSASQAQSSADAAAQSSTAADAAKTAAQGSAGQAAQSATDAEAAKTAAQASATQAAGSATAAAQSATAAQQAADSVDGPGLIQLVGTHKHDGTDSVRVRFADIDGAPPPEIHIGDTAPTDPGVVLWIDTSV